ncbi:MAG: hypothetical protein U1F59_02155 [Candidatus Competibacteraceae bacterium]
MANVVRGAGQGVDRVLVACTERYCRSYEGQMPAGQGLGAACEAGAIRQILYNQANINPKFRVILFEEGDGTHVPLGLQRYHRFELWRPAWDPRLRVAVEVAAIPHWFDAAVLAALLPEEPDDATALMEQIEGLPMVEPFRARQGWNVHDTTRLALRARLARDEPERFVRLSAAAADYFVGDAPPLEVERIYHRLSAAPEGADELDALWKHWHGNGRHEALQALSVVLDELAQTDHLAMVAEARVCYCLWAIRRQRLAQGQLEAAVAEYRKYQDLMQALAARDPDNAGWQHNLVISHNCVGGILKPKGRRKQHAESTRRHWRLPDGSSLSTRLMPTGGQIWKSCVKSFLQRVHETSKGPDSGRANPRHRNHHPLLTDASAT